MKDEIHQHSERRSGDSHAAQARTHGVLCAAFQHRKIAAPKRQVDSQCLFGLQWYAFGAMDRPMPTNSCGAYNMPKQDISDIMEFVPDEDRTEEGTAI